MRLKLKRQDPLLKHHLKMNNQRLMPSNRIAKEHIASLSFDIHLTQWEWHASFEQPALERKSKQQNQRWSPAAGWKTYGNFRKVLSPLASNAGHRRQQCREGQEENSPRKEPRTDKGIEVPNDHDDIKGGYYRMDHKSFDPT